MLGKKESSLKLTFSWAFGSLWWTRLTACNPFIRFSVPPWTSTHPYFHYTSAKSLSVPLECEDNFNWPSAWPWCTAREAHKCKHLSNILCTNWNIKWVCYQVKLRFRDQTYSIWSEYVISSGWFHCPNQCCFLSRLQFKLWLHDLCSSSYSLCIHANLNMQRHFEGKWLHPNRITESKQFCILKGEVLFKHASLQHNFAHNSGNKLKGSLDMYRYDCSKKSSHKHSIHVYIQAIQL